MKALIVPGVTDLNKGDQALVWESHRLAADTRLFESVSILGAGDNPVESEMMCGQSRSAGYTVIDNILKHPRRGVHFRGGGILKRFAYTLFLMRNALFDLLFSSTLILSGKIPLLKRLFNKEVRHNLESILSHDVFFVKGGGFLHSYGERRDFYVFWYFLFYFNLALFHGKKVIVLPNSFGPFKSFGVRPQLRRALLGCSFLSARENASAVQLKNLIDKDVPVFPDLGFYLKSASGGKGVLERLGVDFKAKLIGITIRPWRFPSSDNPEAKYADYISAVSKFVEYQVAQGNDIVLINQSLGPNVNEDDRFAIEDLMNHISSKQSVYWLNENLPCDVLHSVYSELDFLLGTRFHSVIFALSSYVPCVAIAYGGNKGQGIMRDAGLEKYAVNIEDVNAETLIAMYERSVVESSNVKQTTVDYIRNCNEARNLLVDAVAKCL